MRASKTFLVVAVLGIAAIRLAVDAGALGTLGWLPCRTPYEHRPVADELVIAQDQYDEIDSLLKSLMPVETREGTMTVFTGPSPETQEYIHHRLLEIAGESDESRSRVVQALIKVLEDPESKYEGEPAKRWTMAVRVLGDLRATEAVDILVNNLDETGEHAALLSQHYQPVVRAIATIGEPAVPRLIEALSDDKPDIRLRAAATLAEIGQPAFGELEKALVDRSAETRGVAALALGWIGGKEARRALQRAVERETDSETLSDLKFALGQTLLGIQ